jgi:hypothetical protein
MLATPYKSRYTYLSAKENDMTEVNLNVFRQEQDRNSLNEAVIASRIKAAHIVTRLQTEGTRWTLTAKPENHK